MAAAVIDPNLLAPTEGLERDSKGTSGALETQERATWKLLRLCVAIPLVLASGAAFAPYTIIPVSSQAVVNARLSRVRAPIEGDLQGLTLETGDIVVPDQPLARIHALPSTISAKNTEYERNLRDLEQKRAELEGETKASQGRLSKYNQMAQSYGEHLARNLQEELQTAIADLASAKKKILPLEEENKQDVQAERDHLMPRSMVEQAAEALEKAEGDVSDRALHISQLERQIADLQGGYFLGSASQAPPSIEKRDEAASEADLLSQEELALDAQIAELKRELSVQIHSLSASSTINSPVSGVIWARAVAPGQGVGEGDDLFRIADASSIHVEVWLDRRYGPQLSVGDTALLYLSGMGKTLSGRVVSFQGTSRRRLDEEVNAIDLQPVHPDQYHVTIELEPSDRKAIYIGQAAKVLFPGPKNEFKAKLYSWLMRL